MSKFNMAAVLFILVATLSAFLSWWYYVDLLALKVKVTRQYERWAGNATDRQLRRLALWKAVNCGRVRLHDDPEPASYCGLKMIESKTSFYVRYDVQGLDSAGAVGLAAKSPDEVYAVRYDSLGWSDEGLGPTATVSADRHLIIESCPKPVRLLKTQSGRLTCLPLHRSVPAQPHAAER
jgi:hypothetical protein